MEKRSPDKYPNLLISEERRLRLIQSVEDSQESNSISNSIHPSLKKNNENIDIARKDLRLPPIATTFSQQHNSDTFKRRDTSSNNLDQSSFSIKDEGLESKYSTTYSDLSLLLEKYKDDSRLLKISLSKKIDEDQRKAQEAKLKHDYLDYLLSLDLADKISNSTNKITQQTASAEILNKSIVNNCNSFNSGDSSSKKHREESNSSNSIIKALNNSSAIGLEQKQRRRSCVSSLNTHYVNTRNTPQFNGTLKMNYQRNSHNQLYSPYEIQIKRNKTPEDLNYQHQVTKKSNQEISRLSLARKNSDPIYLNNRSFSKFLPLPDVSVSPSVKLRKFSRHLSIPDLQHPSSSTLSHSKHFAPLSVPVSIGSSSTRSVSPSTASEFSIQSSIYSSKHDNKTIENNERERSFDFEAERQLYNNQINQNDRINIDQESHHSPIPTKKERILLPRMEIPQNPYSNIPNQSINQLSSLTINSQAGRSSSDISKSKGKKREMHAITMIVETTEFPYKDYFTWKNNGNTIHKNSGQKSIYYKCSNAIEGCPVNKTVMFRDDGSYLIKYRGKHITKCNGEKATRIST